MNDTYLIVPANHKFPKFEEKKNIVTPVYRFPTVEKGRQIATSVQKCCKWQFHENELSAFCDITAPEKNVVSVNVLIS